MFGTENSIEPTKAQTATRKPPATAQDEVLVREATRLEVARINAARPHQPARDLIADRHKLYTADRRGTRVYYTDYQQKSEVMRAAAAKITTKLDDRQTVAAMLDLAQSRGWASVRLRGSDSFRREAWVQAQERGLAADGYTARPTDVQEADRRKAAAAPVQAKAAAQPAAAKPTPADTRTAPAQATWGSVEAAGKVARQKDVPAPSTKAAARAGATVRSAAVA